MVLGCMMNNGGIGLHNGSMGCIMVLFIGFYNAGIAVQYGSFGLYNGGIGLYNGSIGLHNGSIGLHNGSIGLHNGSIELHNGGIGLHYCGIGWYIGIMDCIMVLFIIGLYNGVIYYWVA